MTDQLALIITRAKVRHQIRSCTVCPLHTQCTRPVPAHIPPSISPPYAILGEAPGKIGRAHV